MVPSITEWLNELLTAGVSELYATLACDLQTKVVQITLRPLPTGTCCSHSTACRRSLRRSCARA